MDDKTRRKLAFLVACKAGHRPTSVYSFETRRHTNMELGDGLVLDHGSRSGFTEEYDYGRKAHWQVKLEGEAFSGFDHGSGHHFEGRITGRSVQHYDHGVGQWFDFGV